MSRIILKLLETTLIIISLKYFHSMTCTTGLNATHINNSRHLAQKYARIFVHGHYLFREANSKQQGTDNVQGQISKLHTCIFAPNGGNCLYYPSNLFPNVHSFENWGIFLNIPQF